MTPQEKQQLTSLAARVATLEAASRRPEPAARAQLAENLDNVSIAALERALRSRYLASARLRALYLETGRSSAPQVNGHIVYDESSDTIKVMLGGSVKTVTTA